MESHDGIRLSGTVYRHKVDFPCFQSGRFSRVERLEGAAHWSAVESGRESRASTCGFVGGFPSGMSVDTPCTGPRGENLPFWGSPDRLRALVCRYEQAGV